MGDVIGGGLLDDFYSEEELAAELDVVVRTVQRWRANREGPPATFIGNRPVYSKASVRAWLKSRERPVERHLRRNRRVERDAPEAT